MAFFLNKTIEITIIAVAVEYLEYGWCGNTPGFDSVYVVGEWASHLVLR